MAPGLFLKILDKQSNKVHCVQRRSGAVHARAGLQWPELGTKHQEQKIMNVARMHFLKLIGPALVLATAALALQAQAQSLGFGVNGSPVTSVNAAVGDTVVIDVFADFSTEATCGGSFDIATNDAILTYQSTSFASVTTLQDPDLNRSPDPISNELEGMAFGGIDGVGTFGIVGSLTFTATSIGTFTMSPVASDCVACGGDFISDLTASSMAVSFDSIEVTVTGTAVGGCIYPGASNYDPSATMDDGSCTFAKTVPLMGAWGLAALGLSLMLIVSRLMSRRTQIS